MEPSSVYGRMENLVDVIKGVIPAQFQFGVWPPKDPFPALKPPSDTSLGAVTNGFLCGGNEYWGRQKLVLPGAMNGGMSTIRAENPRTDAPLKRTIGRLPVSSPGKRGRKKKQKGGEGY